MGDTLVRQLKALTKNYGFSLSLGDLIYSQNGWYVSHAGLLRLSSRKGCAGIHVEQMVDVSDPSIGRWVFRATVFTKESSRGFVGYGDADPSNVSQQVRGAEMRVAETRAVNRALRKAYGIGLCSVEELGSPIDPLSYPNATPENKSENHSNNGQPRLRDKLSLLIRHYRLDANLVKVYAADFCGTQNLGSASRDLVESFINQLEKSARENRDGLVCKLNSYMPISGVTR
ncbi:MAG TPA: hypothetical protein VMI32_13690 [Candidatus Solibacter sp.]|nr:hypothetical protein [Candidatus Solibacter sp.]